MKILSSPRKIKDSCESDAYVTTKDVGASRDVGVAPTKAFDDFHGNADDVLLLIEVADGSLSFDQNQKLRLYALHSIPEYWLLNLNDKCLEVYRKPNNEVYAEKTTLRAGDTVTLSQLNQISIRMADIL